MQELMSEKLSCMVIDRQATQDAFMGCSRLINALWTGCQRICSARALQGSCQDRCEFRVAPKLWCKPCCVYLPLVLLNVFCLGSRNQHRHARSICLVKRYLHDPRLLWGFRAR